MSSLPLEPKIGFKGLQGLKGFRVLGLGRVLRLLGPETTLSENSGLLIAL